MPLRGVTGDFIPTLSDPLDRAACGTTKTTATAVPSNLGFSTQIKNLPPTSSETVAPTRQRSGRGCRRILLRGRLITLFFGQAPQGPADCQVIGIPLSHKDSGWDLGLLLELSGDW